LRMSLRRSAPLFGAWVFGSSLELGAWSFPKPISPVNLFARSLSSFENNQVLIAMVDEAKLRRRVLLRLFGSPLVVSPFVLGMTALTAVWAAGWTLGIGVFAAVAGLLTAGGAGLTRLLLNGEKTAQTVRAELEQEEVQQREARLDELDRRMVSADDDPRPEAALRDLRALLHAFEELAARSEDVALYALVEVRAKVEQLFDQSVEAFEQTLKLGAMAQELQTDAARRTMLEQRENILREIQSSIQQISEALGALQRMGAAGHSSAEMARLREELDQSLAVANNVESRLGSLLGEPATGDRPETLSPQTNEKQKGT